VPSNASGAGWLEATSSAQPIPIIGAVGIGTNEVAALPSSDAGPTKTIYLDLDKGISDNLDAALISAGYPKGISHSVKNGVVTLTGTVDSENDRTKVETVARGVPNTRQVVNEIQT